MVGVEPRRAPRARAAPRCRRRAPRAGRGCPAASSCGRARGAPPHEPRSDAVRLTARAARVAARAQTRGAGEQVEPPAGDDQGSLVRRVDEDAVDASEQVAIVPAERESPGRCRGRPRSRRRSSAPARAAAMRARPPPPRPRSRRHRPSSSTFATQSDRQSTRSSPRREQPAIARARAYGSSTTSQLAGALGPVGGDPRRHLVVRAAPVARNVTGAGARRRRDRRRAGTCRSARRRGGRPTTSGDAGQPIEQGYVEVLVDRVGERVEDVPRVPSPDAVRQGPRATSDDSSTPWSVTPRTEPATKPRPSGSAATASVPGRPLHAGSRSRRRRHRVSCVQGSGSATNLAVDPLDALVTVEGRLYWKQAEPETVAVDSGRVVDPAAEHLEPAADAENARAAAARERERSAKPCSRSQARSAATCFDPGRTTSAAAASSAGRETQTHVRDLLEQLELVEVRRSRVADHAHPRKPGSWPRRGGAVLVRQAVGEEGKHASVCHSRSLAQDRRARARAASSRPGTC